MGVKGEVTEFPASVVQRNINGQNTFPTEIIQHFMRESVVIYACQDKNNAVFSANRFHLADDRPGYLMAVGKLSFYRVERPFQEVDKG
jgi:hypothetical protein